MLEWSELQLNEGRRGDRREAVTGEREPVVYLYFVFVLCLFCICICICFVLAQEFELAFI